MSYSEKKEAARQLAIEWQAEQAEQSPSWGELYEAAAFFEKLGRRFGLLREFRENGIC